MSFFEFRALSTSYTKQSPHPTLRLLSPSLRHAQLSHWAIFSANGSKAVARTQIHKARRLGWRTRERDQPRLLRPISNFCNEAIRICCSIIQPTGKGDSGTIPKERQGKQHNDCLPSTAVSRSTTYYARGLSSPLPELFDFGK